MDSRTRTNPFPGLRPFMQEEADLFFGSDRQTDELVRRLASRRFLAVVGSSGSGKSSLVRAGLLPSLEGGFMAGAGAHWRMAILRPQHDPIGFLARAIVDTGALAHLDIAESAAAGVVETTLRRSSLGLVEATRLARLEPQENLLVLVDQFEELFRFADLARQRGAGDEAPAFVKLLLEAVRQTAVPIYVVVTMRSDFLGDCARFRELPEAISDSQYLIPRLTRDQLQAAITGPIGVRGGRIAPSLLQGLLNDVGDDMDQLPVLQHALMRAWTQWECHDPESRSLDLHDLTGIGGMAEALSNHADEAYRALTSDRERTIAERLFKCLTERGADNRESRRPTPLGRIAAIANVDVREVIGVIDTFRAPQRSFLMPQYDVALDDDSVIDISHESLIRQWLRLRAWVAEEADSRATYLRLVEAARLRRAGKAGLWGEPDLTYARQWQEREAPNATWAERYAPGFDEAGGFLRDSEMAHAAELETERQRAEAEQLAKARELEQAKALADTQRERADEQAAASIRQRRFSWALLALLVLAAGTAVYGMQQQRKAEVQRTEAEVQRKLALSRQLAAQSQLVRNQRPDFYARALLLGVESMQRSPVPSLEADQAVRSLLAVMPRHRSELDAPFDRDNVAFSPDGKTVAWADAKGSVTLWTVGGPPSSARVLPNSATVSYLDFGADGRHLVTIGDRRALRVWDVEHGRLVREIALPAGGVAAAVSDEARYVAVLSSHGAVQVWAAAAEPVARFQVAYSARTAVPGRDGVVRFSPGGTYLAAAAYDHVTVCPTGTWQPCENPGIGGGFVSLGFSRDEHLLAVLSTSRVLVFTLGGIPVPVFDLVLHAQSWQSGESGALALSPDNNFLALSTKGPDATTHVWSLSGNRDKREVATFPHGGSFDMIAFSPDSTRLATAGADNTTRVWEISTAKELARMVHSGLVIRVGFTDSGTHVLTASKDRRVTVWDAHARAEIARLSGTPVERGSPFTANRVELALAGEQESRPAILSRWRPDDEFIERSFDKGVHTIHLSSDGRRLWAARAESVMVWDVDTLMPVQTFEHTPPIDWEAVKDALRKQGESLREIPFEVESLRTRGSVDVLATSRDGEFVATTRADDTVRVWRIGSPRPIVSVQRPEQVMAIFGQAGRYVALLWKTGRQQETAAAEPNVRIFQLPSGAEAGHATLASEASQAELSADESLVAVVTEEKKTLKVFELPSLRERWELPDTSIATFSPDGRFLATVQNGKVAIWQAGTGTAVSQPAMEDQLITTLAFSRDGELFATGTVGGQVILRHTRTGNEIARSVHNTEIRDLAFAPDGSALAAMSEDGSTQVMDCRSGVAVARLSHNVPHSILPQLRVRFSGDGKYLVTESDEEVQVSLWRGQDMVDEACRRLLRDLSAADWRLFLGDAPPTACRALPRADP